MHSFWGCREQVRVLRLANRMMTRLLVLTLLLDGATAIAQPPAGEGPERWESSIAAFEERDKASAPEPGAILFVGSSSIRMWDLASSWPETATINNGFGGSTLADSIHYFDRLFAPYSPSAIILYAGDNDVAKGLSAEGVAADFETLATRISSIFPETPILFLAIKPSEARWKLWPEMNRANELVAAQCAAIDDWYFADIATPMLKDAEAAPKAKWFVEDGLHLSEWGYARWTEVVNELLANAQANP